MDRHQCRAACGVYRHGRPFKPEREGDPTGHGVERVAGDEVRLDLVYRLGRQEMRVFVGGNADKDAGLASAQRLRRVPGALQPFPDRFQHQSLLRVDPDRLARGDSEEFGIESVDTLEESAEARVSLPWSLRIGVVELVDIEAVLGDFLNRIDAFGQHLPESFRVGGAGEAA